MARLVVKCKYLKGGGKKRGGYVKYIATREGVAKIDKSQRSRPVTKNQEELIKNLLNDFPDTKEMLEYEDYIKYKTVGTASDFISRAIEENINKIDEETTTYADYIATRPGAEYISGTHGLFTNAGVPINLEDVSDELNKFQGNVWTIICSLRREDAKTLGFESGERWRDMLRSQAISLANNLKIPIENFKWYAAFHNESYHPHIHLIAYSTEPKEGFLTKKGIENIKSAFANDIFSEEMHGYYVNQTEKRNELRSESAEKIKAIVEQINSGNYTNHTVEHMLLQLADRLNKTKGKKVYGYLKPDIKKQVDNIAEEIASDPRLKELYELWYIEQEKIIRIYNQKVPQRVSISKNNKFKSIKNVIIREAINIQQNAIDETPAQEIPFFIDVDIKSDSKDFDIPDDDYISDNHIEVNEAELFGFKGRQKKNWWNDIYKQARKYLYGTKEIPPDFQKAFYLLETETDNGNGYAMFDTAKMYLSGLGCDKNEETAQEWFAKAYHAFKEKIPAEKDPSYLQYRVGKLYTFGYGVEQDYSKAAEWYKKAVEKNNPFAEYALGCLYRNGQGVEQNDKTAFQFFTRAAQHENKPNAYAQYELGVMLEQGIGTEVNEVKSAEWYAQAYNGFLMILDTYPDDKLYFHIGSMNLFGKGTAVDLNKAKYYFEKSASIGNVNALYGLGKLYLNENFEQHDIHKAVDYLKKAAEKGSDYAMYRLGIIYLHYKELQDTETGLQYLQSAAENGNPYAAEYLQQYQENKACFAVQGAIGLFHHLAMMFRDYQQKNKHTIPDERKIRIKIAEKKQAQGQKQD